MSVDFSEELVHINRALEERQALLPTIDPTAPHPTCNFCDRTWKEHLEDEIEGLTFLKELIDGNAVNFLRKVGEEGGGAYIGFVVSHVFDPKYVELYSIPMRRIRLVTKMRDRFIEMSGLSSRRPLSDFTDLG